MEEPGNKELEDLLNEVIGSVKEPKESLCLSVRLSGTSLSKGLNLHLRAVWVSLRSV